MFVEPLNLALFCRRGDRVGPLPPATSGPLSRGCNPPNGSFGSAPKRSPTRQNRPTIMDSTNRSASRHSWVYCDAGGGVRVGPPATGGLPGCPNHTVATACCLFVV